MFLQRDVHSTYTTKFKQPSFIRTCICRMICMVVWHYEVYYSTTVPRVRLIKYGYISHSGYASNT